MSDDPMSGRPMSQRKAMAIAAKIKKMYPYSSFGRMYVKRGTPENLGRFGATYKSASQAQKDFRRQVGYVGRGLYQGKGLYQGRGGYFGRMIGNIFGMGDLGDKLGDLGSNLISSVVPGGKTAMSIVDAAGNMMKGRGEYTNANTLVAGGGPPVPAFAPSSDGAVVRVSHKEYLGDVFAPPSNLNYQNTTYAINPGLERTFPWLSQIAQNYDEYTLVQCIFTFRSTVSDFAAGTGQVGQVIMSTTYNAAVPAFSDKAQMMQYDGTMSCKTSESMIHGVECDPKKISGPDGRYVRARPVLTGQDINSYDHGLFQVAVTETPAGYANQSVGELWISYTVELRKPKYFTNRGLGISRDLILTKGNFSANAPFGTVGTDATLFGQQNTIGCTFEASSGASIPSNAISLTGGGTPVNPYWGKITIPANFAGNLRLVVSGLIGITTPGFAYNIHATGSIRPINDLLDGSDLFTESYSDAYDATNGEILQEIHFAVDTAANGIDNVIWFEQGAGPTVGSRNCTIDISEYNCGLNYATSGVNDAPILVNRAGTVVL